MPRKPEVDIIDGVIFQSFDTAEGMQGCFQYRGPQLPVVVRRTSRERRITFKKDLFNQIKKSPVKNATRTSVTSTDSAIALTQIVEHVAASSSATYGQPSDRPSTVDNCETGHKFNHGNHQHNKLKKHEVNAREANTSPVKIHMYSETRHRDGSDWSSAKDRSTAQIGADACRTGISWGDSNQIHSFSTKRRKKRRKKNCVYSGVKFGAPTRRAACKPRKKVLPHTTTSLTGSSVTVCGSAGKSSDMHNDWMTPPDSQRKEDCTGLPEAVKAVSRELFTTDNLPETPPSSPPSAVKRKRKKSKMKAAGTTTVNNIHGAITEPLDAPPPVEDLAVLIKGKWHKVKQFNMEKGLNPVLQNCHLNQNCSVMLTPDSMDMPNSPVKSSATAVKTDTDLGDILSDSQPSTPSGLTAIKPKNKALLNTTQSGQQKKRKHRDPPQLAALEPCDLECPVLSPKKKRGRKPKKTTKDPPCSASPVSSNHDEAPPSKKRKTVKKTKVAAEFELNPVWDPLDMPPVLTPQRQLKERKKYTHNHVHTGPDLSPPLLSPIYALTHDSPCSPCSPDRPLVTGLKQEDEAISEPSPCKKRKKGQLKQKKSRHPSSPPVLSPIETFCGNNTEAPEQLACSALSASKPNCVADRDEQVVSGKESLDSAKKKKKKKRSRPKKVSAVSWSSELNHSMTSLSADENNISSLYPLLHMTPIKLKNSSVSKHAETNRMPTLLPAPLPKRQIKRPARYFQNGVDDAKGLRPSPELPTDGVKSPRVPIEEINKRTSSEKKSNTASKPAQFEQYAKSATTVKHNKKKKKMKLIKEDLSTSTFTDTMPVLPPMSSQDPGPPCLERVAPPLLQPPKSTGTCPELSLPRGVRQLQEMWVSSTTDLISLTQTVSVQVPEDCLDTRGAVKKNSRTLRISGALNTDHQPPVNRGEPKSPVKSKKKSLALKLDNICSLVRSSAKVTGTPPGEKSTAGTQTSEMDFYMAEFENV